MVFLLDQSFGQGKDTDNRDIDVKKEFQLKKKKDPLVGYLLTLVIKRTKIESPQGLQF